MLTKKRTRQHVIEDLSRNHVERIALRAGFTVERFANDYGLDLLLRTFDRHGQSEPGNVYFQLKATDHLLKMRRDRVISIAIDARDLRLWQQEIHPVILIVYDSAKDRAYWQHVQSYIREAWLGNIAEMASFRNIRIPMTNVLTIRAMMTFATQNRRMYEQMSRLLED